MKQIYKKAKMTAAKVIKNSKLCELWFANVILARMG
jgi:hypothetical protein